MSLQIAAGQLIYEKRILLKWIKCENALKSFSVDDNDGNDNKLTNIVEAASDRTTFSFC